MPTSTVSGFLCRKLLFSTVASCSPLNFEAAIERLARAGAGVERRPLPQLAELVAKHGHLLGAEALHFHRKRLLGSDADRVDRRVARIRRSERMTAVDLIEVMQTRKRLIAESGALVGEAIIAFPTTSQVAMPVAPLEADDDLSAREKKWTVRNSMLSNFLDWCGVAIPNGMESRACGRACCSRPGTGDHTAVLSAALSAEALIRAK